MTPNNGLNLKKRMDLFSDVVNKVQCIDSNGASHDTDECFCEIVNKLYASNKSNSHVYVIGNGGSAGIASHMAIDLLNMCNIKAHTLYDLSMLTCISNDHGYENVFSRQLDVLLNDGDILLAISSSGKSMNILNAANLAQRKGAYTITFTGFSSDNPLKKIGAQNIWLDSDDYGVVEIGHAFLLHNIADRLSAIIRQ